MESLPIELYWSIFDHLHLIDLARLKQVCKKLRSIVLDYRIKELVIINADLSGNIFTCVDSGEYQNSSIIKPMNLKRTMPFQIHRRVHLGSSENSMFNPRRFINIKMGPDPTVRQISVYDLLLRNPQFNVQFLKSLACTYSDSSCHLCLEDVNKFVHLQRLEMDFDNGGRFFKPNRGKLTLPNLKTLLLNIASESSYFEMQVEAPNCEGFHRRSGSFPISIFTRSADYNQHLHVTFANPNSVKCLSLYVYHKSSHVFKNIEFLQIVRGADLIDQQFFSSFPRLNTLKILEHNSLEGLKQLFRMCRQRNVQLTFHGIRLVDGKELDAFESDFGHLAFGCGPNHLLPLLENYDKLEENLNFLPRLNFSERAARLLEADAGRFTRIFNNLSIVSSKIKIERPDLFLRLLNSTGQLRKLWITNSGMLQQHFDQLANIQTLNDLEIQEETKKS